MSQRYPPRAARHKASVAPRRAPEKVRPMSEVV
jgi:hypothetical protein